MVVSIGAGGTLAQNLGFGDLADEKHVASQVELLPDLAGEHGVYILRQVVQSISAALHSLKLGEFVHVPAGLHAKMADGLEGNALGQHIDIELTALLDELLVQVARLDGNRDPGGIGTDLECGVGNVAVILF